MVLSLNFPPGSGGSAPTPLPPIVSPWVRPADWLALPTPGAQTFVGLLAVHDTDSNFVAVNFSGDYTVDWGDEVVENFTGGTQAEHNYVFSAINSGTLTSRGYKQVIVVVTPQSGQDITAMSLDCVSSLLAGSPEGETMWLDILINVPALTTPLHLSPEANTVLHFIEQVAIINIGTTNNPALFSQLARLRNVALFDTSAQTNFASWFQGCSMLTEVPFFDTSNGLYFNAMFSACSSLQAVPLFDTHKGIIFSSMFNSANNVQTFPQFDTSSGTSFDFMFSGCNIIENFPNLNTSLGSNFSFTFSYCTSMKKIPLWDLSGAITIDNFCVGCPALAIVSLHLPVATTVSNMFSSCSKLFEASLTGMTHVTDFTALFYGCVLLVSVAIENTSAGIAFDSMFNSCQNLKNIPYMDTSSGISFISMFQSSAITDTPALVTSSGLNFSSMFAYCAQLSKISVLDTSLGTTLDNMFIYNLLNTAIPAFDCNSAVNLSSMVSLCYSLSSIKLINIGVSIDISFCRLSTAAIIEVFNNLKTVTAGSQTINIANNYGIAGLTPTDRLIATGKGWLLVEV